MTPEMLMCWIIEQDQPPITRCIARFGRQKDDTFVSGNMCYKLDVISDHDAAHWEVVDEYFSNKGLSKSDYPMNIIIPQCHVRYVIGCRFWNYLMPEMFLNNTLPAKAVFAHFVMGLYATKFWDGKSGMSHGCAFSWSYRVEGNTVRLYYKYYCCRYYWYQHNLVSYFLLYTKYIPYYLVYNKTWNNCQCTCNCCMFNSVNKHLTTIFGKSAG